MRCYRLLFWMALVLIVCACADSPPTTGTVEFVVVTREPATSVDPATVTPPLSLSPLRGHATITFNDLWAEPTLYLSVGDTFMFERSVPDLIHIGDERVVARVLDTVRLYKALAPGQTEVKVVYDQCRRGPTSCAAPVVTLTLRVVVQ